MNLWWSSFWSNQGYNLSSTTHRQSGKVYDIFVKNTFFRYTHTWTMDTYMQICIKPVHILYNHTHTHTCVLIISYLLCVYTYYVFTLGYITFPYIKFHSTTLHNMAFHSTPRLPYLTKIKHWLYYRKQKLWMTLDRANLHIQQNMWNNPEVTYTMWKMMGLEDDPASFWLPVNVQGLHPRNWK